MILHGNGNGTFQPPTTIGTTTTFSTVVTEDFNKDTNPDLVVHQEEVGLVIVLGNGAAASSRRRPSRSQTSPASSRSATSPAMGLPI